MEASMSSGGDVKIGDYRSGDRATFHNLRMVGEFDFVGDDIVIETDDEGDLEDLSLTGTERGSDESDPLRTEDPVDMEQIALHSFDQRYM